MGNDLQKQPRWTRDQVELLKKTVAKGLSDDEMRLFLYVCKRTGLDPFLRQIYAVKRFDGEAGDYRMAIQTGIDGYRLLAARHPGYAGSEAPVFETDPDELDHPSKASVTVYKFVDGERCSFTGETRWREYAQKRKDGSLVNAWQKMPWNMLAKCAEAQALRKGFPAEVQGLMVHEEMPTVEGPQNGGESDFAPGQLYEGTVVSIAAPDKKAKKPGRITVAVRGAGTLGPIGFWATPTPLSGLKSLEDAVGRTVQVSYIETVARGNTYRNLDYLAIGAIGDTAERPATSMEAEEESRIDDEAPQESPSPPQGPKGPAGGISGDPPPTAQQRGAVVKILARHKIDPAYLPGDLTGDECKLLIERQQDGDRVRKIVETMIQVREGGGGK